SPPPPLRPNVPGLLVVPPPERGRQRRLRLAHGKATRCRRGPPGGRGTRLGGDGRLRRPLGGEPVGRGTATGGPRSHHRARAEDGDVGRAARRPRPGPP